MHNKIGRDESGIESARKKWFVPAIPVLKKLIKLTDQDARDMLEHCAKEMNHLAAFLPDLYKQESQK